MIEISKKKQKGTISPGCNIKTKINNFPILYGMVERNSNTCFVNIGSWIQLNPDLIELNENESIMKKFQFRLRRFIDECSIELFDEYFINRTIKNIDIGINYENSYVYMNIEVFLFFDIIINIKDIEFQRTLDCFSELLLQFLEETQEFSFKPTRKS